VWLTSYTATVTRVTKL